MSVFQVPHCDFVVISQPEALVQGLFLLLLLLCSERGGLFCTHGYQAAGALFLPFHNVAILLCDKRRGVLLRRSQGDRCPQ